jgi:hypothetical protein
MKNSVKVKTRQGKKLTADVDGNIIIFLVDVKQSAWRPTQSLSLNHDRRKV